MLYSIKQPDRREEAPWLAMQMNVRIGEETKARGDEVFARWGSRPRRWCAPCGVRRGRERAARSCPRAARSDAEVQPPGPHARGRHRRNFASHDNGLPVPAPAQDHVRGPARGRSTSASRGRARRRRGPRGLLRRSALRGVIPSKASGVRGSRACRLKLLVDERMWIDYSPRAQAKRMRRRWDSWRRRQQPMPCCSTLVGNDARSFLLSPGDKRICGSTAAVDEGFCRGGLESAGRACATSWGSVIVPVGQNEALRAMTYRDLHDDFEDDLRRWPAVARVDADYVVASDRALLRHAPSPASTRPTCALLRVRNQQPATRNKFGGA